MFNLCHFLNVTFMRTEDAGLTALEIGISISSQGAGKTEAGGGQAHAQMSPGFLPFLPHLCLAWGAADFGSPALPAEMPKEKGMSSHWSDWGRLCHLCVWVLTAQGGSWSTSPMRKSWENWDCSAWSSFGVT